MRQMMMGAVFSVVAVLLLGCSGSNADKDPEVSGRMEAGLRVLTFDLNQIEQNFRIYRGDYVRPEWLGAESLQLVSKDLNLDMTFPASEGGKPYFKVPVVGVFQYSAGPLSGTIEAIDFAAATYSEVSALQAVELIKNLDPLILDVRTPGEFQGGHLENAVLIPVQSLKSRLQEIEDHKDRPVFIYCRSGNRSTVASRILIDAGFNSVSNLRKGINEWAKEDLPLVR